MTIEELRDLVQDAYAIARTTPAEAGQVVTESASLHGPLSVTIHDTASGCRATVSAMSTWDDLIVHGCAYGAAGWDGCRAALARFISAHH